MEKWAWSVGMLVVSAVPAIVGGGVVWHFVPSWGAVLIWEVLLFFFMSCILVKGEKR
jgi:hypothetical protein